MKKLAFGMIAVFMAVIIAGMVDSRLNAQQKEWVHYHGDFASFDIRWEYRLDFESKGPFYTYKITDPSFADKPLIITRGYRKMDFQLYKKKDYKQEKEQGVMLAKTGGAEKAGTTPTGNIWREIFLFYSAKGSKGPQGQFIRIYYDDCPPELSSQFDMVIKSIQLKDAWEVPTGMPTMPSNF